MLCTSHLGTNFPVCFMQRFCIHDPFQSEVPRCAPTVGKPNHQTETENAPSLPHFSQLAFNPAKKKSIRNCFARTASTMWASEFSEFRCLFSTSPDSVGCRGYDLKIKPRMSRTIPSDLDQVILEGCRHTQAPSRPPVVEVRIAWLETVPICQIYR